MKSELGQALLHALCNIRQTQTWLAEKIGITQPSLNHLINNGSRPRRETLAPMCHAFDRADGLEVLCGHLRDEIAAAGYRRSEIVLSTHPADSDEKLDRALDNLRAVAGQRRDVAYLLLDLAALCEELPTASDLSEIRQERRIRAADSAGMAINHPKNPTKSPSAKRSKRK